MSEKLSELEKKERRQAAKNKIQLMRRHMHQNPNLKLQRLVREYVSQRPEVAITIVKKWLTP